MIQMAKFFEPRSRFSDKLPHSELARFRCPYFSVTQANAHVGSIPKDYFIVHFGPRAGVVAVSGSEMLLVRQYRFLTDAMSWEIPGGKVDVGESASYAAWRECLEETGYDCSGLYPLVSYFPGLDNVDNPTTVFLSESVRKVSEFKPNETEVADIRWVTLTRCLDMVFSGEILDAMTVAAILAYVVHRSRDI